MKILKKITFFALFLLIAGQTLPVFCQVMSKADENSDCYMPRHPPTIEEKKYFIEQISELAIEAEKTHGVPAPVIAGMAILESGYGLTFLAQDAKNIYGYKIVSGKTAYTLTCQPKSDPGNKYVKFKSWADSMDFVANQLATSKYYRRDTEKYKADLVAGINRKSAATTWLVGISNPYNHEPYDEYVKKVRKCINNPYNWSEKIDEKNNLWNLSPEGLATSKSPNGDEKKIQEVKKIYSSLIDAKGRYMENGICKSIIGPGDDPVLNQILQPYIDFLKEHNKLPYKIQDCTYPLKPKSNELIGRTIMLNVDAEKLAQWTISACKPKVDDVCLNAVMVNIWSANNGQFPITGTVAETSVSSTDCTYDKNGIPSLYAFRDGVTVRVKSFRPLDKFGASCTTIQPKEKILLEQRLQDVLSEPVINSGADKYGNGSKIRVANLAVRKVSTDTYLTFARDSYLKALEKDQYELLTKWVTKFRKTVEFTKFNDKKLGEPLLK